MLNQAAVLTRSGDGWALAPTSLSFAGGNATVSGRSGSAPEVHAQLARNAARRCSTSSGPTSTSRARRPAASIMRGRATAAAGSTSRSTGSAAPGWCSRPSRSTSRVAAIVNGNQAALRAVAASDGAIVGRAQARFAPLGGGPLVAELMNAPLFAQLRYAGPADTLWRLTGSEVIDMSGPLAVGADIGGRLADPHDPRLAPNRRTPGSKARSPAWSSTMSRARRTSPARS